MRDIKEFEILDINAVDNGLEIYHLMNNAGNRLAEHILAEFSESNHLFLFVVKVIMLAMDMLPQVNFMKIA